jgi:hypothetical protein
LYAGVLSRLRTRSSTAFSVLSFHAPGSTIEFAIADNHRGIFDFTQGMLHIFEYISRARPAAPAESRLELGLHVLSLALDDRRPE